MGTVTILDTTTRDPITLMGERAGICWDGDISDPAKNYRRGWDCIESGHGRVMEFVRVDMILDGYSARVMREWYTHIGGAPTRLQASTRYIDYSDFGYITPKSVANDKEALECYQDCMQMIAQDVGWLVKHGVPREDVAMLLPLGMTTRVVDSRNLRNLVDMSRQRMCQRAYWEFRQLMDDICDALEQISQEWETIVETQFRAKCNVLGYCPEKHGCGRYAGRQTKNGKAD